MYKPLALIIMDGVGLSAEKEGNAVMMAKLPNLREISQHFPFRLAANSKYITGINLLLR